MKDVGVTAAIRLLVQSAKDYPRDQVEDMFQTVLRTLIYELESVGYELHYSITIRKKWRSR